MIIKYGSDAQTLQNYVPLETKI